MINEEECAQLLEEYELLRRRVESIDFAEMEEDFDEDVESAFDSADLNIDLDDIARLEEIKERLRDECGEDLPEDEDAVDIPDYIRDEFTE